MRARFIVEREDADVVVIADVGETAMSVTNDAEEVLRYLHDNGVLRGRRLLYHDSMGFLDEIEHDGRGGFVGFKLYAELREDGP